MKTLLAAGSGELILVVDDEAPLVFLIQHRLEANGYKVLTAANGAEAIQVFLARQAEVRAVLTDMSMPHMEGPALIRAIREIDPTIPIIAVSGLTNPTQGTGDAAAEVSATLLKPFTSAALVTTVQSALAKTAGLRETRRP